MSGAWDRPVERAARLVGGLVPDLGVAWIPEAPGRAAQAVFLIAALTIGPLVQHALARLALPPAPPGAGPVAARPTL